MAGEEDYEPEVILGYDTQSCLKQTKQRKCVCVCLCVPTLLMFPLLYLLSNTVCFLRFVKVLVETQIQQETDANLKSKSLFAFAV